MPPPGAHQRIRRERSRSTERARAKTGRDHEKSPVLQHPGVGSPSARNSRSTCMDEADAEYESSCSRYTVVLNLSGCSSCAVFDPLKPKWMSLILFSSCCLSSSPDVTASRSTTCSSYSSSFSFLDSVSATLSLSL